MFKIASFILLLLSIPAYATPKANVTCVDGSGIQCKAYEMRVAFDIEGSAGRRGGYGIVARSKNDGKLAYWTEDQGWNALQKDILLKATEPTVKKLEAHKEFLVYRGPDMCKLTNNKSFELYAWYYGLMPDDFNNIRKFISRFEIKDQYAENFWNSILFSKALKEKQSVLVFSKECESAK